MQNQPTPEAIQDLLEAKAIRAGRSAAAPQLRHLTAAFDSAAYQEARAIRAEERAKLLETLYDLRAAAADEAVEALYSGVTVEPFLLEERGRL